MQYRIECIQTVFGEERERRLKLAFDIIWNLGTQKTKERSERTKSQSSNFPTVTAPSNETEGGSKEDENTLLDSKCKLQSQEH
jgi:hypothetical protein